MAKGRKRKASSIDADKALAAIAHADAAKQPGQPQQLADDELFVIDTQPDNAAVLIPQRSQKRARASKEKKLTRAQAILAASMTATPMGKGTAYAPKKRASNHEQQHLSKEVTPKKQQKTASKIGKLIDAWDDTSTPDAWVEPEIVASRPQNTGKANRPLIAAVEVDPAGCSYNPEYEQHQDAIAEAVAVERNKQIERDLQPAVRPTAIPFNVATHQIELSEMALDLGPDDDVDVRRETSSSDDEARMTATNKKSRKDRDRRERQRQQDEALADRKALKALRRDIDDIKSIQQSVEAAENETQHKLQRRKADLAEKELQAPPKLGRHRWQPANLQVLTSDDVSGSLRKLRAFPMVSKDRFNSLQKRGVVQVTVPQHWMKPTKRRVKHFEKGAVREKAIQGQEVLEAISRKNRQREKKKAIRK